MLERRVVGVDGHLREHGGDVQPRAAAVQLLADEVLEVVADVALGHGDAHRKRHDVAALVLAAIGGEGALDHAHLRAVAVGDDQLIALLNEVGDGLGGDVDGVHLFVKILTQRVAAQSDDDSLSHGDFLSSCCQTNF